MWGSWFDTPVTELAKMFETAKPYPHVVLENFLQPEWIEALVEEFPSLDHPRWWCYHNPIEYKYALDDFTTLPITQKVFAALDSPELLARWRALTQIPDLESDPTRHGAGLHYHPPGGKLDLHLDYSLHPVLKKERRLNLLLYLNRDYHEDWGGQLELWDDHLSRCVQKIAPIFNRAVLFQTSDRSFHGLPHPLTGPGRQSLAIYYLSPPRPGIIHRAKAEFYPYPGQPLSEGLRALYRIRSTRRLEPADLLRWFPDWETSVLKNGYW